VPGVTASARLRAAEQSDFQPAPWFLRVGGIGGLFACHRAACAIAGGRSAHGQRAPHCADSSYLGLRFDDLSVELDGTQAPERRTRQLLERIARGRHPIGLVDFHNRATLDLDWRQPCPEFLQRWVNRFELLNRVGMDKLAQWFNEERAREFLQYCPFWDVFLQR
jgi:hypothetical protein